MVIVMVKMSIFR